MISELIYNLGGWDNNKIYANDAYVYERGTKVYTGWPAEWKGKVAVPYASDYGYAMDFSKCTQNLNNYNDNTCTLYNWMKNIMNTSGNNNRWLLTHYPSDSYRAWGTLASGSVFHRNYDYNAYGIIPVLYLNANVSIISGSGTSSSPYKIEY